MIKIFMAFISKGGIISVLIFVAFIAILLGVAGLYPSLIIGMVLIIIAFLLSKKWGVCPVIFLLQKLPKKENKLLNRKYKK